jgi:hypothetical protein
VNAAAYPVATPAVNPVLAQFDAWLASPAGQAWSRAGAAPPAPAPATTPPVSLAGRGNHATAPGARRTQERKAPAPADTAAYARALADATAAPHTNSSILAAFSVLAALGLINIVVAGILGSRSRGRHRRRHVHRATP